MIIPDYQQKSSLLIDFFGGYGFITRFYLVIDEVFDKVFLPPLKTVRISQSIFAIETPQQK